MSEKTNKHPRKSKEIDPRIRYIVAPVLAIIAVIAVVYAVITIVNMPKSDGAQRGVGANGFRAYEEKDADLGVGEVVTRDEITDALGTKAQSVEELSKSTVFNIDGNRGQTATYNFTKANGKQATVYVDLMVFKNTTALDDAHIYINTAKTDPIANHPAYYMHAQTIGSDREYRMMVVSGTKVYKFVLTQPFRDITINEVSALATLKKLATKANY